MEREFMYLDLDSPHPPREHFPSFLRKITARSMPVEVPVMRMDFFIMRTSVYCPSSQQAERSSFLFCMEKSSDDAPDSVRYKGWTPEMLKGEIERLRSVNNGCAATALTIAALSGIVAGVLLTLFTQWLRSTH